MIKVTSSYSKKVPVAGEQYSSQQYHASVEIELSDALSPEQLQEKIHATFATVRNTVENEINGNGNGNGTAAKPPTPSSRTSGNGNGNSHGEEKGNGSSKASNAQIKFMTSLATQQDVRLSALNTHVQEKYKVDSIYELTKHQASELVDGLKNRRIKIVA